MRIASALKPLTALALAACIAFCGLALTGCGENDTKSSETQAASQAETEQDNCYGDDLPAMNTQA